MDRVLDHADRSAIFRQTILETFRVKEKPDEEASDVPVQGVSAPEDAAAEEGAEGSEYI
jgi:hypothetical protein